MKNGIYCLLLGLPYQTYKFSYQTYKFLTCIFNLVSIFFLSFLYVIIKPKGLMFLVSLSEVRPYRRGRVFSFWVEKAILSGGFLFQQCDIDQWIKWWQPSPLTVKFPINLLLSDLLVRINVLVRLFNKIFIQFHLSLQYLLSKILSKYPPASIKIARMNDLYSFSIYHFFLQNSSWYAG